MLVTGNELLQKAQRGHYAVPAFNVDNLEILQAVVSAAQEARSSIIIATSESSLEYAGFRNLRALVYLAAEGKATLALHLDHGKDLDLIKHCIDGGWTSVMFDGSDLPYEENVKKTQTVVRWAHQRGVSVEAELGALGTDEDLTKEGVTHFTDPDQAVDFVKRTKIDSLAISIGTAHGPFKAKEGVHLDFKRLAEIKKKTRMPLVLHGASGLSQKLLRVAHNHCDIMHDCVRTQGAHGVPDAQVRRAIRLGINKVNVGTDLRLAFVAGMRRALLEHTRYTDERKILAEAHDLVKEVALQKIQMFRKP
ncbi:MAG: class II fructose-bisphosphate aldolase [Patescibacteria group bacterium]